MKNTNISTYGCSTLKEDIARNRKDRIYNRIIAGLVVVMTVLIISFITIR